MDSELDVDRLLRRYRPAGAIVDVDAVRHEREALLSRVIGENVRSPARVGRTRVVAGVTVLALVGTGYVVASNNPSGRVGTSSQFVLVSARKALAVAGDDIARLQQQVGDGSRWDRWFNLATGDNRMDHYANGSLLSTSWDVDGSVTSVDYSAHSWSSTPAGSARFDAQFAPASITAMLTGGSAAAVGSSVISGERVEEIRTGSTSDGVTVTLWVDSTTFLPVQELIQGNGSTVAGTFTWMSQSSVSSDEFAPAVPSGFTHDTPWSTGPVGNTGKG